MSRARNWKIDDVLDFEYFLAADAAADDRALQARDRGSLAKLALGAASATDRRGIFRQWLEERRAGEGRALPGAHFRTGWQSLIMLGVLLGLVVGASLTAGLLHYQGREPVNVAIFLAWTVGIQWALLLAVAALWLLRRATRLFDDFHPVRWLLAGLLWALGAGLRRLPGEQRERWRAVFAKIGQRREIYGSLTVWPLLIVTQLFGVAFNLGILATLLGHVALSDVAFGWQSTLQTSPEEAFRLATQVALPWQWAPHAHPTFDQVVASRFVYSEGIDRLSSTAMASWWPFLAYAVFCYGLLVRGALLISAIVSLRRTLGGLTFNHQDCNALYRRMSGPLLGTESTAELHLPTEGHPLPHALAGGSCVALIAREIELPAEVLAAGLARSGGWQVALSTVFEIDHPSGNAEALATIGKMVTEIATVTVLIPSRRPPIRAVAASLQGVVQTAGAKAAVVVVLVGRPAGADFRPVEAEELQHWRNFNAIHGLHLEIICWSPA